MKTTSNFVGGIHLFVLIHDRGCGWGGKYPVKGVTNNLNLLNRKTLKCGTKYI